MCQTEKWKQSSIRIAGIVRESIVDGPGIRFTVFCQGCPHGCKGCHNPETHDFKGGYDCSIEKLLHEIDKDPLLSGVTFSGGEPMCQPEAFLTLAREIKKRELNIVIFTGYTLEELQSMADENPSIGELLLFTDYLIDGRFVREERDLTLQFRGSGNQRYIDMNLTREAGHIVSAQ
ncbi:anaerobic ribonucleoside-triphosphate reductase activating protein [Aminipila luticellarii]|uniref:Anaerobic ribonucleoside-triphosphate reductase-activating protein n=1 Tax=Aminipila luticellarii TaxID=2507160 RepID=A0A410PV27_9FIRM|nr:anaerobic ribonucleoside-triphosphate reductase activating protein [Aminipila luticellarii]QAT42802.1 anaerobic ribonucleoside-triphosphate reductase activating protein [Aminipila luticellarii]